MLRTDRLLLRRPRLADAEALAARRSDPEVAKYQNWIAAVPARTGAGDDRRRPGGDGRSGRRRVVDADHRRCRRHHRVRRRSSSTSPGRVAPPRSATRWRYEAWGNGYAQRGRRRRSSSICSTRSVSPGSRAMLHPDNTASAMVLERVGLLFEGHTRLVVLARRRELRRLDVRHDPRRLGGVDATAAREPASSVRLIEVTADNQRAVRRLRHPQVTGAVRVAR